MNKSTQQRREFVDQQNEKLSMRRQCDLLSIHRSGLYYKPIGESEFVNRPENRTVQKLNNLELTNNEEEQIFGSAHRIDITRI